LGQRQEIWLGFRSHWGGAVGGEGCRQSLRPASAPKRVRYGQQESVGQLSTMLVGRRQRKVGPERGSGQGSLITKRRSGRPRKTGVWGGVQQVNMVPKVVQNGPQMGSAPQDGTNDGGRPGRGSCRFPDSRSGPDSWPIPAKGQRPSAVARLWVVKAATFGSCTVAGASGVGSSGTGVDDCLWRGVGIREEAVRTAAGRRPRTSFRGRGAEG